MIPAVSVGEGRFSQHYSFARRGVEEATPIRASHSFSTTNQTTGAATVLAERIAVWPQGHPSNFFSAGVGFFLLSGARSMAVASVGCFLLLETRKSWSEFSCENAGRRKILFLFVSGPRNCY